MKKIENYSVINESNEFQEIRILLVDDQSFVRRFISKSIEPVSHLNIVGTADNGKEAIEQVESLQPDVILIDIEMPEMDGVKATEIISQRFPNCKTLILSSYKDGERLHNALRAGAKGYLLKGSPVEELTTAIYSVHKGYSQLSPGLLEKVLTPEVEILKPGEIVKAEEIVNSGEIVKSGEEGLETKPEDEWAESTREAIDTLPRVSLRALLYIFLALVAVAIPWALFAKVDETGAARGRLEPKGKVVRLDSPVSGTVISIEVQEGELVEAGQSLLKLESELVKTQLQQQQQKLAAQQNQLDRLESLKNQQLLSLRAREQQNQAQQFEKEALIDQAKQSLLGAKATYNSQLAEKAALVEQAKEAIVARESDRQLAQIRWETAQEQVVRYQEAYEQGVISRDRLLAATKESKEAKESLNRTASEIAQAKSRYREQQNGYEKLVRQTSAEIDQAKLRLQEQQRGFSSLVKAHNLNLLKGEEELKNTEAQITTVKGELAQTNSIISGLNYQLKQRVIYAPVEGTVFQLPIQKPGAVVQAGQNIAQIAPGDSPLILRARMNSSESGFLEVGLPVKIKFDAYPFQDYGIVSGRLTWVSPDSRVAASSFSPSPLSNGSNQQGEFYELEIELEQNFIQAGDRRIMLTPGQTAKAEIIIRQRRLVDIFIDPFKSLQKGGIQL